jgi:hypothetical protein
MQRTPVFSFSKKILPIDRQEHLALVLSRRLIDGSHRGGDGAQEVPELDTVADRDHLISEFNLPRRMRPVAIGLRRARGRGRSQRAVAMAEQHKEESHRGALKQAPRPPVLLVAQVRSVPSRRAARRHGRENCPKITGRWPHQVMAERHRLLQMGWYQLHPDRMVTDVVLASRSLQIYLGHE